MKSDALLIGLVVAVFMYMGGYPTYGILIGVVCLGMWFLTLPFRLAKPRKAKAPSGVEPIVIESTRGAPYRIPDDMTIWHKADGGVGRPWWEKVTKKGPIADTGKLIGKGLRKVRGEEKEEEK